MKIVVDGCGNDLGSIVMMQGAEMAVKEMDGLEILLTGDERTLGALALENGINLQKIHLVQADSILTMEDSPMSIMEDRKDSSMAKGFELLKSGEGEAFVSAGNTGALLTGSSLLAGRLKGVKRAGIATSLPTRKGGNYVLMDAGANVECRAEMLVQFALMASVYAEMQGVKNPRVGIINNGTEHHKGTPLIKETYALLQKAPINFVGSVEGKGLNNDDCDVAVTDGFTGNVVLKTTEGVGKAFGGMLKDGITNGGIRAKLGYLLLKPTLKSVFSRADASEVGGAPLLGISYPVIKAHGGSDAKAVKSAILQASKMCQMNMNEQIIGKMEQWKRIKKEEGAMTAHE